MAFRKLIRSFVCLAVSATLVPCHPLVARAANNYTGYEEIQVLKGDMYTLSTKNLVRVSVTDPSIADINDAKPAKITLMGKQPGQTALFVWDESGKKTYVVRVVDEDLDLVRTRIAGLLDSAGITGVTIENNYHEGKVVLSGDIPEDKIPVLDKIVDPLSDRVINFVKQEAVKDLIQIDMQVTELSTTLSKVLGVDWTASSGSTGGVASSTSSALNPAWTEANLPTSGKFKDLLKLGDFSRTSSLVATVNALITEGKAKVLSKPRLVVVNGKEATFLVGGEIPIRTTTTSSSGGGSISNNVEFKEYGVSMAITPTINDGKVDIVLNVEISDVDQATQKAIGSADVAFTTRSAQTQLRLDDRQTIVLAGLIKKRDNLNVDRVPFLGSIPILGLLFRSTNRSPSETEVVISLTPTIIHGSKPAPAPAPAPVVVAPPPPEPPVVIKKDDIPSEPIPAQEKAPEGPIITKNAASGSVMVPEALQPYARAVQEKISSAIAYPYEAQQNGWQGTVKLSLIVRKDGSLRDVIVKESSGYDVFDKDAVNTAQILAPYDPFPESITEEQLTITIPIVYSLDSFLKNVAKHK